MSSSQLQLSCTSGGSGLVAVVLCIAYEPLVYVHSLVTCSDSAGCTCGSGRIDIVCRASTGGPFGALRPTSHLACARLHRLSASALSFS
jgi:hypothetical protein